MNITLSLTIPPKATSTEIAKSLRQYADMFEGADTTEMDTRKNPYSEEDDETEVVTPVKASSKKGGKKAASFDDDEDDTGTTAAASAIEDDEDEDDGFMEAPKKTAAVTKGKTKTKKITIEDVNDACKKFGKANGRPNVLKVLKKQFKVESVTELEPTQYAAVIEAMSVED